MSRYDGKIVNCSLCGIQGHERNFVINGKDIMCPDKEECIERWMRQQEQDGDLVQGELHNPLYPMDEDDNMGKRSRV